MHIKSLLLKKLVLVINLLFFFARPSRRGSRQLGLLPNEQQQLVEQCTMVQQKQNKKISPADLSTAANSANNSAAPSAAHSRQNSISFQPHEGINHSTSEILVGVVHRRRLPRLTTSYIDLYH